MTGYDKRFYTLSTGQKSPFPTLISDGAAASLVVDSANPILVVMMVGASASDINIVGTGDIGVALDREGTTAVLIWSFFSVDLGAIVFDTPLHFGLEEVREFPNFSARGLAADEERGAVVILQDEAGIVLLMRSIVLPRPILEGLAPMLAKQISARGDRKLRKRHSKNIERYRSRMPDLAWAYALAPIKGRAA